MSESITAWVDQDEMRRLASSLMAKPLGHELNRMEIQFGSQFEGFAGELAREEIQAPQSVSQPSSPLEAAEESVAKEGEESPSGPSPSVVRSAVQFLKKAQIEGRAAGAIGGVKLSPAVPAPAPPSGVEAVSVAVPPNPEPRPIHSPFRRVNEAEVASQGERGGSEQAPTAAVEIAVSGKIARPPAPSGDDPILARVTQFGKWLKGPVGARNFFVSNTEGKVLIDEVANSKLIQVARSLASASGGPDNEVASLHVRIGEDSILEVVPTPSQFGTLILGLIVEHPLPEEVIREVRLGLEEVANARLLKGGGRKG